MSLFHKGHEINTAEKGIFHSVLCEIEKQNNKMKNIKKKLKR